MNGTATFAGTGNPTDTGTVESINTTAFLSDRATTLSFNTGDIVNFDLTIAAGLYGYLRYNTPGANYNPSFQNTTSGSYSQTLPTGVTKVYIFSGRTNTANDGTVVASVTCTPIAPSVTSLGTSSGTTAGGTSVVITGTSFTGATTVRFGATSASFTVNSDTQITATSPAGTGTVDVTVTNATGTSTTVAADQFTYVAPAPTVTAISPTSGTTAGGTSVTITGTNFTGATGVTIGGAAATSVSVVSATSITATTPAGTAGTASVLVTTAGGTNAANTLFTYVAPTSAPTVTSISPSSGTTTGGTSVTITGTNFTGATGVTIGGAAATSVSVVSATSITATTPAGTAGTASVLVTTAGGTNAANTLFTYVAPTSAPTVTSISPNSGPAAGGTSVTITGTNLTGATSVKFGATSANITSNTATQIVAASPAGTGTVDITVTTSSGTSSTSAADRFTYGVPVDSQNAKAIQNTITKMVATSSGQLISSAVDTAIADAFSDGGSGQVNIGATGARINFAAEPRAEQSARSDRIDDAFRALAMASNPKKPPAIAPQRDWSLWLDIRGTGWKVRDAAPSSAPGSNDLTGSQLNITGGLGRKLNSDTLVGILVGHELFKFDIASLGGGLKGRGETVGGYFSRRFYRIRFDATVAWSAMAYDVTAGSANGALAGSRWLFSTGLTGNEKLGPYMLEPSLKVFALWERQREWTDSLGTLQEARSFSAGRASGGSKIGRVFDVMDGKLSPFIGLYGDYYFQSDNSVPAGQPVVGIASGWSARVTSGVTYVRADGAALGFTTELGGLGANFLLWSGQVRASLSF